MCQQHNNKLVKWKLTKANQPKINRSYLIISTSVNADSNQCSLRLGHTEKVESDLNMRTSRTNIFSTTMGMGAVESPLLTGLPL